MESVSCARYLGVDISSGLTLNSHIDHVTANANQTLGFIRCNIKTKMPKVREAAYNSLVRPQLEYASAVCTRRCEYPKSNKSSEELLAGQPVTSKDSQV